KMLGYSEMELLEKPFLSFVHPDDQRKTMAAMAKLVRGEPTLHVKNRYRCKNGQYRWLSWNSVPDLQKNVIYAIAYDLTERKQLQKALEQAEARWCALITNINDVIIIVDKKSIVKFI